jgi:hypothetical protein
VLRGEGSIRKISDMYKYSLNPQNRLKPKARIEGSLLQSGEQLTCQEFLSIIGFRKLPFRHNEFNVKD